MFLAIAKKELLQLQKDPRLIALIIIMPLLMLVLFGYALKLEPKNVNMAYVDNDRSFFSNLIKTGLWSDGYFNLIEVNTTQQMTALIRNNHASAGMVIDANFSKLLTENAQPHIHFYVDGTMPSLTTAMKYHSKSATGDDVTNDMYFSDEDSDNVVIAKEPFIMDTTTLFNPDDKETWFFLPGVIGVLIMQVALILTGTSVVREREKQTLEQLFVTPMSKSSFVLGKIVPYIIIAMLDFYLILLFGWWLFALPLPTSWGLLLVLSFLFVSVMIALGLLISLVTKTQQQAMFIAIFIIVPSMLLSGFIFPLDAIPAFIRPFSAVIPFTYFIEIIRSVLIKQSDLSAILTDFMALAGFLVLFIGASIFKFKKVLE